MLQDVTRCYKMLQDVTRCYRMLLDVMGCYGKLQDVTLMLHDVMEFQGILWDVTGRNALKRLMLEFIICFYQQLLSMSTYEKKNRLSFVFRSFFDIFKQYYSYLTKSICGTSKGVGSRCQHDKNDNQIKRNIHFHN